VHIRSVPTPSAAGAEPPNNHSAPCLARRSRPALSSQPWLTIYNPKHPDCHADMTTPPLSHPPSQPVHHLRARALPASRALIYHQALTAMTHALLTATNPAPNPPSQRRLLNPPARLRLNAPEQQHSLMTEHGPPPNYPPTPSRADATTIPLRIFFRTAQPERTAPDTYTNASWPHHPRHTTPPPTPSDHQQPPLTTLPSPPGNPRYQADTIHPTDIGPNTSATHHKSLRHPQPTHAAAPHSWKGDTPLYHPPAHTVNRTTLCLDASHPMTRRSTTPSSLTSANSGSRPLVPDIDNRRVLRNQHAYIRLTHCTTHTRSDTAEDLSQHQPPAPSPARRPSSRNLYPQR